MLSAVILSAHSYPAMPLARQQVHQRCVHSGPLVLGAAPLNSPTPTADRDRTVSRRSKPSSRTSLNGEQPYPWDLLQPKDEARWQSLARQKAMKYALVKAQDYAEAAEVKLGQLISLSDRLPERGGPPGFLSAQRSLSEAGIVPQDVAFRQSVIAQYEILVKPE